MSGYEPSDEEVRQVYMTLIDKSWESPEAFEVYQQAWAFCAVGWGVLRIEKNGRGRVIRQKDRWR